MPDLPYRRRKEPVRFTSWVANTPRAQCALLRSLCYLLRIGFLFSGSTLAQDRHQIADFILHFTWLADGASNFRTEEFSITASQAMDGHVHGADANAAAGGQFGSARGPLVAREGFYKEIEQVAFAVVRIFLAQAVPGLIEHRERPVALKGALGGGGLDEFNLVTRLHRLGVQRHRGLPAAALLALLAVPFVGQEVLEHRQQE